MGKKSAKSSPADGKAGGKKRKSPSSGNYWNELSGWKSVDIGDDFLLGAEEGGFAGLEVLENPTVIDPEWLTGEDHS